MKQKIAVCISGIPRLYKISYESFKKQIINYNPEYDFDFFLYIKLNANSKYNIDVYNYDVNDIINTYKPKKYFIDNNIITKKDSFVQLTQQCDNVINSIELKIQYEQENNMLYDYTMRYRFEIYNKNPIKLLLPNTDDECVNANVNDDIVNIYKSHFVNLDMQNVLNVKYKSWFISILHDLEKQLQKPPISDIFFICKSSSINNIVKYKHINKLIKNELPHAYYEIIFFSILYMCGITKFTNGNNNYYCLHQVFCINKHPLWNHSELNNLKTHIINEFPDLCNNNLYTNVILL